MLNIQDFVHYFKKNCMLNIQNCVYCLKIMYIKYTKLCMFFEKLCILNIQNCVYFLKFWVPFFFFFFERVSTYGVRS